MGLWVRGVVSVRYGKKGVVMLTLEKKRGEQREYKDLVVRNVDFGSIPRGLVLSYIGARICYWDGHPLDLVKEGVEMGVVEFLLRLKKAGHYSVFAHTPVVVDISKLGVEEKYNIAKTYFKAFFDDEVALFNLRHFAEVMSDEEFRELLSVDLDLGGVGVEVFRRVGVQWEKVAEGDLGGISGDWSGFEREVIVLKEKGNKFGWMSVVAHNFSRVFSHQFVRHTWLNFNQRSHRYTKVDSFIIPDCFVEEDKVIYKSFCNSALTMYNVWSKRMKREWARFIIPQGVVTTVIASGPRFVWDDFVKKRNTSKAQGEIRELAKVVNGVIIEEC
jgi:thymidylate synthase (FAD)